MVTRQEAEKFFKKRFNRNPKDDKDYFEEWYNRLNSNNPELYMDKESEKVYTETIKHKEILGKMSK